MEDKRLPMPQNFQWYSVCGIHREYHSDCSMCNAGRWVNDELHELEHWLHTESYSLWYKWANRVTHLGEPGHEARTFLEKIFPNLKSSKTK